ncbi:MAG TPA: ATP-binding protein [Candidatus Didemnitutus sp.]|nr:ATP-binding protein [Candidatus Didemnitutus sp.]
MIIALLVLLVLALTFVAGTLWRQNRQISRLRESLSAGRPHHSVDGIAGHLPGWRKLVDAVNRLAAENQSLKQQRTDQLTQLEATLGNLREAVLIVDEANYIHLANRALRDIFPGARNLVNLRLELIVRSAAFLQFVTETRNGQELPRQEFEINDGQNQLCIEVSGAPIPSPDGRSRWALFVIHDMTQQRKLERMRRDFVANASHELRTPLSIIKGYVETLVDGHLTMTPEERDKFLKTIQRHSDRLNAIIQDLLTISRLESATPGMQPESIDLASFLEAFTDDYRRRPNAADHEIVLNLESGLGVINADSVRLNQIFSNLFENALKYTPKGSRVELAATAPPAGEIEIAVRDNGPGIPPDDLPHIFERFYRVDKGRSRETGGTGLGLSIVKHLVLLHGGRVWAESTVGEGTAIVIRLPRNLPAAATRSPAAA